MSRASSRGPVGLILLAALLVVLAIGVGHVVAALFFPLFWLAVIVAAVVLVRRAVGTRHDR